MRSFTQHLAESKKIYSFKIWVAGELTDETYEKVKLAADSYKIDKISKPKRLPIQRDFADFSQLGAIELNMIDLTTDYPVTPHELVTRISDIAQISPTHVVVKTPVQCATNTVEDNTGESVLAQSELKTDSSKGLTTVEQVEELLRELESMAMEYSLPNKEKACTTNDLPQGKYGAISGKNTIKTKTGNKK